MDFRRMVKSRWFVPAVILICGGVLFPLSHIVGFFVLILSFLVIVAKYDTAMGTFLPLAVLFVIVLLVMTLLLGALAYIHALMSGAK